MKQYWVYILASKPNGTLYIGVTNNLERRVNEHKQKNVSGFTKNYGISQLVYYEDTPSVEAAIAREKQLKNWHRQWKVNLIEAHNPHWLDLSAEFTDGMDSETSSE